MPNDRPARASTILFVLASLVGTSLAAQKLDPESEKFFRTARLIMTREETKIWNRLPDAESRKEFIADFWLKRDPDPDTAVNEYQQEFEARVDTPPAVPGRRRRLQHGPRRVYIFMGPPDKFEFFPSRAPRTWLDNLVDLRLLARHRFADAKARATPSRVHRRHFGAMGFQLSRAVGPTTSSPRSSSSSRPATTRGAGRSKSASPPSP
jgi:GWxTD domain-containing protein